MRQLIDVFDTAFAAVHCRTIELLDQTTDEYLYRRPRELPRTFTMFTVGEYVLRSAATVEQTMGGITRRLWDDPFEWTLPEKLDTVELVRGYAEEAEASRVEAFAFLASDDDLLKQMPAPIEIKPIAAILTETLARAEHFQGRAFAAYQFFSDSKLPRR